MNLYRLELKRVCKTRMTAILLAIALVLAVVMAYLPVTLSLIHISSWSKMFFRGRDLVRSASVPSLIGITRSSRPMFC